MSLWFGKGPQIGLEVGEEKGGQPVGERAKPNFPGLSMDPPPNSHTQPSPTDWVTTGDTNSNKHKEG